MTFCLAKVIWADHLQMNISLFEMLNPSEHEIAVMPIPSLEKASMLPFLHVEVMDQGKFLLWTFPTIS
jgi:hypothetical protein